MAKTGAQDILLEKGEKIGLGIAAVIRRAAPRPSA